MSIPGELLISRHRQAAPPWRSLPARAKPEGGKQGLRPGCGGEESSAPRWPKIKSLDRDPDHRLQEGGGAGGLRRLLGGGAAGESTTTFPIVAKSAQWISEARFPLRPPTPFLEFWALPPRLRPCLVTTPPKNKQPSR